MVNYDGDTRKQNIVRMNVLNDETRAAIQEKIKLKQ